MGLGASCGEILHLLDKYPEIDVISTVRKKILSKKPQERFQMPSMLNGRKKVKATS